MYLLLQVLNLLELLLLRIKYVLLMEDGVTELSTVDSLCQESLDPVLDEGHGEDFVQVGSHLLLGVQQRGDKRPYFLGVSGGERVEGAANDLHGQEMETGGIERGLEGQHFVKDDTH